MSTIYAKLSRRSPGPLPHLLPAPRIGEAGAAGLNFLRVVGKLHAEIGNVLTMQDAKSRLTAIGADPVSNTPEQFAEFIRIETARWTKVIKAAGVRVE